MHKTLTSFVIFKIRSALLLVKHVPACTKPQVHLTHLEPVSLFNVFCRKKAFMIVTASFHCPWFVEFKLDMRYWRDCDLSVVVTVQEGDGDSSLKDGPILQTASASTQSTPVAVSCSSATEAPKPPTSTVEPLIEGYSHMEVSDITEGI